MVKSRKELGQHWLNDPAALKAVVDAGSIEPADTVLEIGPGTGKLTEKLLQAGARVVAVEKDEALVKQLVRKINDRAFYVVTGDILEFDLDKMSPGYKIVANIPYYLTSNLIRTISESSNPPARMVLLVQKEVAERLAAKPGQMSLLAVSAQLYWQVELGRVVPAALFQPPPKVDSQIVIFQRREQPRFKDLDYQKFFQLVRAGFSERRKMLRSSLAGGLQIGKTEAEQLLTKADINGTKRAQELSLTDWHNLYQAF